VDVVDSGLKPDRPDARHAQHFTLLFDPISPPYTTRRSDCLNAVAIGRIVEKERKIREQVKPVILPIRVGKKQTARCRIVMVVQLGAAAERLAPSEGSMVPNRSSEPSCTARRGISPEAFHCAL